VTLSQTANAVLLPNGGTNMDEGIALFYPPNSWHSVKAENQSKSASE
jgi:hypothetical protein